MIDVRAEHLKALAAVPVVAHILLTGSDGDGGADWIRNQPAPGEWAAIEVIAHMADTDQRALERIRLMLDEDDPELPAFDPEALARQRDYLHMPVPATIDRLETTIGALLEKLRALDDEQWQRTGRHSEHGSITIADYLAHVTAEDVDHLAQIARLVRSY